MPDPTHAPRARHGRFAARPIAALAVAAALLATVADLPARAAGGITPTPGPGATPGASATPLPQAAGPSAPPVGSAAPDPTPREFFSEAFGDPLDYANTEDVALVDEALIHGTTSLPTLSGGQLHLRFGGPGYFSPMWGGYDTGTEARGSDAAGHDREGNLLPIDGRTFRTFRVRMNVSDAVGAGIFFYTCPAGVHDRCQSGIQFVSTPGWHTYEATLPATDVSGIRVAITGNVTVDVDWVQVLSTTADRPEVVGPLPEVLDPDLAGAVPYVFPLGSAPVAVPTPTCGGDWATLVRGDAWDFSQTTDVDRVENHQWWRIENGLFRGVGVNGTDGELPGDPNLRMQLGGRSIATTVFHRATVIVPRWYGRYSQQFGGDGGWVLRIMWKAAPSDRGFQISAPIVEYPNDPTLSVDLDDPRPFQPGRPATGITDLSVANQHGWSTVGQATTFRLDLSEPYRDRLVEVDHVLLATDDCAGPSALVRFTDHAWAPGGRYTISMSPDRSGPWTPVATGDVAAGINERRIERTALDALRLDLRSPQWVMVSMVRGGVTAQHVSTGPVSFDPALAVLAKGTTVAKVTSSNRTAASSTTVARRRIRRR